MKPSTTVIGGKGHNLIKMKEAGLPIPDFFCLTTFWANDFLKEIRPQIEQRCSKLSTAGSADFFNLSAEIQEIVRSHQPSFLLQEELKDVFFQYFRVDTPVSVRSSATEEDGERYSFAGQHSTELFVTFEGLLDSIKKSIASTWNPGVLKYRIFHGLSLNNLEMALVIQRMILATRSGVGFSMDISGNLADKVIIAGYGLGEGIVSDRVPTDTFLLPFGKSRTIQQIGEKSHFLDFSSEKGVFTQTTPKEKIYAAALAESELTILFGWLYRCQTLLNAPADIEFSLDEKGQIYLLQMRPITGIDHKNLTILDNTNIAESYPGITLPLTFDFAEMAYQRVFSSSADAFMLSNSVLKGKKHLFDHLIVHEKGRIYYRLDHWYKLMSLVTSSKKALESWEKAVGLSASEPARVSISFQNKLKTYWALTRMFLGYKRGNRRFFISFSEKYSQLRSWNREEMSSAALWRHYEFATDQLFQPWHLTIVNDFIAFKAFGWLTALLQHKGLVDSGTLANDLMSGLGGVDSEEAVFSLIRLVEHIKADEGLSKMFNQAPEFIQLAAKSGRYPEFFGLVEHYLERFGDRTLAELKLETPSFRSHPLLFFGFLKSQLAQTMRETEFREKQVAIQEAAEAKIQKIWPKFHPIRLVQRVVLSLAVYGLANRENMRFCRTRAYSAVKDIFNEIGLRMEKSGHISTASAVFYLNMADLKAYCLGNFSINFQEKVNSRMEEFKEYATLNLPDRIMYSGGKSPDFQSKRWIQSENTLNFLSGIPVSGGQVRAPVTLVTQPDYNLDVKGRILVTKTTDPGWVYLMAQAAGLVSEKGSLLSHTAIVGRELGIPTVVGVAGALEILREGEFIALDGTKGTIERGAEASLAPNTGDSTRV